MRNKYLEVCFNGLCKQESIRKIHKDIRKVTEIYQIKYDFGSTKLESYVKKLTEKTKKNTLFTGLTLIAIADNIVKQWQKDDVFTNTNKLINERVREQETKDKKDAIESFIKVCRAKKEIFFLCSDHLDCAEDHKDYQRRLYVDGAWQKDIFFKANKDAIRLFIAEYEIKTFQWVTGKPVWMITRPNCRHYFVALTWGEVKKYSIDELVNKYHTHSDKGERKYQPIWHPTNQEWYTVENVEAIIEKYKERLWYHQGLYNQVKSDELKRLIDKDKLLLRKWRTLLMNLKK